MKATFKAAAAPSFSLQAAASQAYAEFPHLKNDVVFIDCQSGQIISDNADMKSRASYLLNTNRDLYQAQRNYNRRKTCGAYLTGGVSFILFYPHQDIDFLPEQDPQKRLWFVFNHEMAHRLAPLAHKQNALSESVSDAYATFRHLQMFGRDKAFFDALAHKRSIDVVEIGDRDCLDYFTWPAIGDILANEKKYAVAAQTPDQMVTSAMKIASATHLDDDKAKKFAAQVVKATSAARTVKGKQPR